MGTTDDFLVGPLSHWQRVRMPQVGFEDRTIGRGEFGIWKFVFCHVWRLSRD